MGRPTASPIFLLFDLLLLEGVGVEVDDNEEDDDDELDDVVVEETVAVVDDIEVAVGVMKVMDIVAGWLAGVSKLGVAVTLGATLLSELLPLLVGATVGLGEGSIEVETDTEGEREREGETVAEIVTVGVNSVMDSLPRERAANESRRTTERAREAISSPAERGVRRDQVFCRASARNKTIWFARAAACETWRKNLPLQMRVVCCQ